MPKPPGRQTYHSSVVWGMLSILGLAFCWVNALYLLRLVEQTSTDLQASEVIVHAARANASVLFEPNQLPHDHTLIHPDKAPILNLLQEAGLDVRTLSSEIVASIPSWSQVTALYGHQPRIYGMDQGVCDAFQQSSNPAEHFLGVAGTFNTGTNLLAALLIQNCHLPARIKVHGPGSPGIRWQVPWGKHTPVDDEDFRQRHKAAHDQDLEADNVLAAVAIRDPAVWMASMCRHPYAMRWQLTARKDTNGTIHCPHFVMEETDGTNHSVPVHVQYSNFTRHYESMVHHWNEWYGAYLDVSWPRLLLRFEDLIFHPRQVTQKVCECAGGKLNSGPFRYMVESAKKGAVHGTKKTNYVDAIVRYGTSKHHWKGMSRADLAYVKQHLDPRLMQIFGYSYPTQPDM
jgi:hypothetical protein